MQDSYSILYKNHAVKQYFLPVLSWGETCRSAFYHMEPATQCQRSGSYGRTEGEETHLQRSSFLLFHRIKNRKSLLDSRWSIHLFFDQPLCCYLSLYRYNHSNVLDPDPKVIILVISRFFEEKTESVWCFSTFYQKVHFISFKTDHDHVLSVVDLHWKRQILTYRREHAWSEGDVVGLKANRPWKHITILHN